MTNDFQITIPKPCHEDWNKMTTEDQGRHCKVCCKTVVDFTKKTADDIKNYLVENASKKICGRFNTSQVSQPLPGLAAIRVNRDRYSRLRMFALALYLVFGGFLFGTNQAQAQQTVGRIKVEHVTVGELAVMPKPVKKDVPQKKTPVQKADTARPIKRTPINKKTVCEMPVKGDVAVEYFPEVRGMVVMTKPDTAKPVKKTPIKCLKKDTLKPKAILMGKPAYSIGEIQEVKPLMGDTVIVKPIELEPMVGQIVVLEPLPPIEMIEPLPPVEMQTVEEINIVAGGISVQWVEAIEVIEPVIVTLPVEEIVVENQEIKETLIVEVSIDKPKVEVFPNPTNGNIMLKYTVKTQGAVSIDVIDGAGKKVRSLLKSPSLYPGVYSTNYDLKDLRNGNYYIVMQTGNEAVNTNVILTK